MQNTKGWLFTQGLTETMVLPNQWALGFPCKKIELTLYLVKVT